jgi:hypothetical protein
MRDAHGTHQVLRLDVSVANAEGVDVGERAEDLVHIQLDIEHGDGLLELGVVPRGTVDRFGHEFEQQVEKDLVLFLAVRVEEVFERYDVGVVDKAHNLQLAVLEALVLQHLFDGHRWVRALEQLRLEHDAKGPIANDFVASVRDVFLGRLARAAGGDCNDGVWLWLVWSAENSQSGGLRHTHTQAYLSVSRHLSRWASPRAEWNSSFSWSKTSREQVE